MKYLALVLVLTGCTTDLDDLLGGSSSGGDEDGGGGAGASGTPSSSSSGGAPNGGAPNTSSTNAGGAPSANNSTTNAGGNATTDVTTTGPDTTTQTTTGEPAGVFVACDDGPCDVSNGNVCCLGTLGSSCVPGNQCGGFDTPVSCDDPFDCDGGKVCCGHTDVSAFYEEIRCESNCEWPDRTLCAPNGPPCEPINGGTETQCEQSSVLPDGYLVCKP